MDRDRTHTPHAETPHAPVSRRPILIFVAALCLLLGWAGLRTAGPTGVAHAASPRTDWVTVAIDPDLPECYYNRLLSLLVYRVRMLPTDSGAKRVLLLDRLNRAAVTIGLTPLSQTPDTAIYTRFYAPVAPFATVEDGISRQELAARWQGSGAGPLIISDDAVAELTALFGQPIAPSVIVTGTGGILARLQDDDQSVAIVPFDRLQPRFKVLAVDGINVLDNHLDPASYPLAVAVAAQGPFARELAAALASRASAVTNRDADRLTTLVMTGVTAMSRVTALKMEQKGYDYPARVISPTLAAADITHISNEVPFLDDCQVDASENNLTLCSNTTYWTALDAVGTDIVGLSGNHVNDFGRAGARRSIDWYREHDIPIYGSGMNVDEACAPLLWEHNGNRFAFIAALAFGPSFAWATDELPGACYYYDHKDLIFDTIHKLRSQVDVIAVELQYLETYNPYPTDQQVVEFRELRQQGADIVTGVQSHVPQAIEPYGPQGERPPGVIVYGLGNFFFDQMWSWQTRTELMARHTIYEGRVISTEILTAVLEDYAQPRWATESERAGILRSIFDAAPARAK